MLTGTTIAPMLPAPKAATTNSGRLPSMSATVEPLVTPAASSALANWRTSLSRSRYVIRLSPDTRASRSPCLLAQSAMKPPNVSDSRSVSRPRYPFSTVIPLEP